MTYFHRASQNVCVCTDKHLHVHETEQKIDSAGKDDHEQQK